MNRKKLKLNVNENFSNRGRKSVLPKLDKKLIVGLCYEIEHGLPYNLACDYLGICRTAFYTWMRKGNSFLNAEPENKNPHHEQYAKFAHYIKKAKAKYLVRLIKSINQTSKENKKWNRDFRLLERRDFNNWGRTNSRKRRDLLSDEPTPQKPNDQYL